MRIVYETIGFSGSGKSTWAKNFIKDKPKTKIVSPDSFREMLNGEYKYLVELDNVISKSCFDTAKRLLLHSYDVVMDCGNLTKDDDRRGLWKQLNADIFIAVVMPVDKPAQWYVKRRMQKPHWDQVDWLTIVKNEMNAYQSPTLIEFDEIWRVSEDGSILIENKHTETSPDGR